MEKNNQKIKEYWEERAKNAQLNPNATTDDVYLRELEIKTFIESIKKLKKKKPYILDLGCGDGFTTIGVARHIKNARFLGIDYSANMIGNAQTRLASEEASVQKRMQFTTGDATALKKDFSEKSFDVILSSRCLINLSDKKQQYKAIADIASLLKTGGYYISVENFIDGNDELNKLRTRMGLPEIPVRWHNLFFKPTEYLTKIRKHFKKVEIINFSSAYYYATRVIYSKYCQMLGAKPDYLHEMHKLAIDLPLAGNYSPIKLVIHKR